MSAEWDSRRDDREITLGDKICWIAMALCFAYWMHKLIAFWMKFGL